MLIDLVRGYKVIWSTVGQGYKDAEKKHRAWVEIGKKMNIDGMTLSLSVQCTNRQRGLLLIGRIVFFHIFSVITII